MSRADVLQATGRALLKLWAVGTFVLDDARLRGVHVPALVARAVEHVGKLAVAVWRKGTT